MLTRVYLDNYRCFSNFEWRPGKLVVLAGRNGSGKSAVLEVITGLARVFDEAQRVEEVFPAESVTRWERRAEQKLELDVRLPEGEFRYMLRLDHSGKRDAVRLLEERLSLADQELFLFKDGNVHLHPDDGAAAQVYPARGSDSPLKDVPELPTHTKLTAFRRALQRWWLIKPMPSEMDDLSDREVPSPEVHLTDFADWYRWVNGDALKVTRLMDRLRTVLDGFASLRLKNDGRDARILQAVFQLNAASGSRPTEVVFDLHELSEGQRLLIALYALVEFGPVRDGLLCLDEPTNYLALEEIEPWLKELEAALDEDDGQVFIASHNSEVVNRLWATHGVWFERDAMGPVRLRATTPTEGLSPAEIMARGWG